MPSCVGDEIAARKMDNLAQFFRYDMGWFLEVEVACVVFVRTLQA